MDAFLLLLEELLATQLPLLDRASHEQRSECQNQPLEVLRHMNRQVARSNAAMRFLAIHVSQFFYRLTFWLLFCRFCFTKTTPGRRILARRGTVSDRGYVFQNARCKFTTARPQFCKQPPENLTARLARAMRSSYGGRIRMVPDAPRGWSGRSPGLAGALPN